MTCRKVMDTFFESPEAESAGFFAALAAQVEITLHLFHCPRCRRALERWKDARNLMTAGFFPPVPGFIENSIMEAVRYESGEEDAPELPGFLSFRSWVITGLIILASLVTAFFGMDFAQVAANEGSAFLIPLGLTIGMVVTLYGALFIGTHLKELSARFRLH
jgi:hypothetical protein